MGRVEEDVLSPPPPPEGGTALHSPSFSEMLIKRMCLSVMRWIEQMWQIKKIIREIKHRPSPLEKDKRMRL